MDCETATLEISQDADFEASILERMAVVEKAIRLQMSLGASHLQQVEMAPETFGLPGTARTHVRSLRRRRNDALHCVGRASDPQQVARGSNAENAPGQVPKLPPPCSRARARAAGPLTTPRTQCRLALPATVPWSSRAQQVERLYRLSLNMAMKMEAATRAMTAVEGPRSRPTALVRRGSLPTRLAEALDPGKSKNGPSGAWCRETRGRR